MVPEPVGSAARCAILYNVQHLAPLEIDDNGAITSGSLAPRPLVNPHHSDLRVAHRRRRALLQVPQNGIGASRKPSPLQQPLSGSPARRVASHHREIPDSVRHSGGAIKFGSGRLDKSDARTGLLAASEP